MQSELFRSGHRRARVLRWLLGLSLALAAASTFSGILQLDLLERARTGMTITATEADTNDRRQALLGMVQLILAIATGISFMAWFYRAHQNLLGLGSTQSSLKYRSGWAIGGFLVPFLNLVRPYQVMKEVWEASDPRPLDARDNDSRIVGWWWAFFLISSFASNFSGRLAAGRSDSLPDLIGLSWALLISDLALIPSALLAMTVVGRVDVRQEQKRIVFAAEVFD